MGPPTTPPALSARGVARLRGSGFPAGLGSTAGPHASGSSALARRPPGLWRSSPAPSRSFSLSVAAAVMAPSLIPQDPSQRGALTELPPQAPELSADIGNGFRVVTFLEDVFPGPLPTSQAVPRAPAFGLWSPRHFAPGAQEPVVVAFKPPPPLPPLRLRPDLYSLPSSRINQYIDEAQEVPRRQSLAGSPPRSLRDLRQRQRAIRESLLEPRRPRVIFDYSRSGLNVADLPADPASSPRSPLPPLPSLQSLNSSTFRALETVYSRDSGTSSSSSPSPSSSRSSSSLPPLTDQSDGA